MPLARHYTGHFKAVVTKPQNVLIMRDVACAGYVAGCNTQFFALERDSNNKKTYSMDAARQAMQDRLSFADDVGAKYGSMLAFPCTEGQLESNQGMDTVMSVTSRLLPWEVTGLSARDHSSFPGGQVVYNAYNNVLGLDSVHYGEDMKAAENQDFISQATSATPRTVSRASGVATHYPPPFPNLQPDAQRTHRLPVARRGPPTTPRASSARTASTTRSQSRS
jgi:hypothetical protein